MRHAWLVGLTAISCLPRTGAAQVPAWYPPHNLVVPTVSVAVSLDATTADFTYSYAVANGASAQQRIDEVYLKIRSLITAAQAPTDWKATYNRTAPLLDGFLVWGADGPVDPAWVAANPLDPASVLSEIAPGSSRTGFALLSPCAVRGTLPYYIRGYNHMVEPPADTTGAAPSFPTWQQDAVSGSILGPGDCTVVSDWGSGAAATEGFVGLVNFASGAVFPAGPMTIQLKFSRSGETVFPATLLIKINTTTVTTTFKVNSRGDRVAVFTSGVLPLKSGKNTLSVSIDGIKPGTTQTGTDSDSFIFYLP